MELLGKADNDHEEEQDHQSRGANNQTDDLELCHHRLTAGTLVPNVILDIASEIQKERNVKKKVFRRGKKTKVMFMILVKGGLRLKSCSFCL